MTGGRHKMLIVSAATVALMSGVSTHAIAQVQQTARSIGNNESVFIDGKTLTITQATSKDDVAAQIAKLGARDMGPGAIIFRSGEKLYIVDAAPLPPRAFNDIANDRQRSYGLNDDRQRSYGLNDDRQRSYGLNDDRQRSYGLNDDRQRSYGLNDDRQRSYGLNEDRQRSYGMNDPAVERLRSYGLSDPAIDRLRSYGLTDAEIERQRVYMMDPDYAYYRLKKNFDEAWGTAPKADAKK